MGLGPVLISIGSVNPGPRVTRKASLLGYISDLDPGVVNETGPPVGWHGPLGPDPLAVVATGDQKPNLERAGWRAVGAPDGAVVSSQVLPVRQTYLLNLENFIRGERWFLKDASSLSFTEAMSTATMSVCPPW